MLKLAEVVDVKVPLTLALLLPRLVVPAWLPLALLLDVLLCWVVCWLLAVRAGLPPRRWPWYDRGRGGRRIALHCTPTSLQAQPGFGVRAAGRTGSPIQGRRGGLPVGGEVRARRRGRAGRG